MQEEKNPAQERIEDLGAGMMHERDLPHERETQTRAALGTGGVAPVKPLPDLFLLGLGDAGAVVFHGDHGAAVFPTERDADVSAFAPVFIRVLHQIEHRPREERGVVRGRNAGLDIGLERHAALVRGDELVAAGGLYSKMWSDYQSSASWKVGVER